MAKAIKEVKGNFDQATLDQLVEIAKGFVTVTVAVGAKIIEDVSSSKLDDPKNGGKDSTEVTSHTGHAQSVFTYSNGMVLKVVWTFAVDIDIRKNQIIKAHIIIKNEEVLVRPNSL